MNPIIMTRNKNILLATGLLLAGLFLGWLIFADAHHNEHVDHATLSEEELEQHVLNSHTDEEGNIVYTCSMHPDVRQSEPGNCPICGMDLIVTSAGNDRRSSADPNQVHMTHASMELARVRTAPVQKSILEKEVHLTGRIEVDEREIVNINSHFPGRITALNVNFTGAPIKKGEPMAAVYSPELVTAQRELLEALKQGDRNPRLVEMARQKLRNWEISEDQIALIGSEQRVIRDFEIISPVDGYVLNRLVSSQDYVDAGTVLFEAASLNRVWVVMDVYEEDLDWIRPGDNLDFSTRTRPGESHTAVVDFIDPVLDNRTRTVRVRAEVENIGGRFKPGMIVRGTLSAKQAAEQLHIPASAVLWTGPRSIVFVEHLQDGQPFFEAREVTLGSKAGNVYVIEDGLSEDERVVVNGAFRVDSEAQLMDRLSMMNRTPGKGGGMMMHGMDHGDMDMDMNGHNHGDAGHSHIMEQESFDDVPDDFRSNLTAAVEAYIGGKDALVESDLSSTRQFFGSFIAKLEDIGIHGLSGDGHMAWMESYEILEQHAETIIQTDNIEEARAAFRLLSDGLISAVQMFGIEGVVYHQYCPMAFSDEGANWLSINERIQNPYLPETMPGCGEVIERIES